MKRSSTGDEEAAYYELDEEPVYEFKFIKSKHILDDKLIIAELKEQAKPIYKSYAVKENGKTKAQVATYKEAKSVLDDLKSKDSNNLKDIEIEPTYGDKKPNIKTQDKVVAQLYEKKEPPRHYAYPSRAMGAITRKINLPVSFITPMHGYITTYFGDYYEHSPLPHYAMDISGYVGKPVKAAADGVVIDAGDGGDYGNMVEIDHGGGVVTLYAHGSKLFVEKGDRVKAGKHIMNCGNTGFSFGSHLHFEIRYNGKKINPLYYCNF